jgi:hypothetical protein
VHQLLHCGAHALRQLQRGGFAGQGCHGGPQGAGSYSSCGSCGRVGGRELSGALGLGLTTRLWLAVTCMISTLCQHLCWAYAGCALRRRAHQQPQPDACLAVVVRIQVHLPTRFFTKGHLALVTPPGRYAASAPSSAPSLEPMTPLPSPLHVGTCTVGPRSALGASQLPRLGAGAAAARGTLGFPGKVKGKGISNRSLGHVEQHMVRRSGAGAGCGDPVWPAWRS